MKPTTIGLLVNYIVENRKDTAFVRYNPDQIALSVNDDIENNNLTYVLDEEGDFMGVMTFIRDECHKILFIKNLVVTKTAAMVVFTKYIQKRFPNWSVLANRKNKKMNYNTHRLFHLIQNRK